MSWMSYTFHKCARAFISSPQETGQYGRIFFGNDMDEYMGRVFCVTEGWEMVERGCWIRVTIVHYLVVIHLMTGERAWWGR